MSGTGIGGGRLRAAAARLAEKGSELGAETVEIVVGIALVCGLGAALYGLSGTAADAVGGAGSGIKAAFTGNATGTDGDADVDKGDAGGGDSSGGGSGGGSGSNALKPGNSAGGNEGGSESTQCDDDSHSWGDWKVAQAATCTEDGLKVRYCSKCGKSEQAAAYATGHSYTETQEASPAPKEATCTTGGVEALVRHRCSSCGSTFYTGGGTTAALGHDYSTATFSWSGTSSATATFTCSHDPSHTEAVSAKVASEVTTAATCTEKGTTTYTAKAESSTGKTASDAKTAADVAVDPDNHDYEAAEKATDSEGTEFTHYVCTRDESHQYWHNGSTGQDAASKEDAGWVDHSFSVTYEWSGSGAAASGWTCTATRYCSVHGKAEDTSAGTVESAVTKAATCTASGTAEISVSAFDRDWADPAGAGTKTVAIDADPSVAGNHSYEVASTNATDLDGNAFTVYVCTRDRSHLLWHNNSTEAESADAAEAGFAGTRLEATYTGEPKAVGDTVSASDVSAKLTTRTFDAATGECADSTQDVEAEIPEIALTSDMLADGAFTVTVTAAAAGATASAQVSIPLYDPQPDPENGIAQAVYSADDNSFTFYKRDCEIQEGKSFNGKTATAVYTGFETNVYNFFSNPWGQYTTSIYAVSVEDEGIAPVSTAFWFGGCSNLASVDLRKLDTSSTVNAQYMFTGCSALKYIEGVSNLNTSAIASMSGMFKNCSSLTDLSLSWDTSNVQNMRGMFNGCSALEIFHTRNIWDTSHVKNMSGMFENCEALSNADVSDWDTSSVEDMSNMFYNCTSLTNLNIFNWNTLSVTTMEMMFGRSAITYLDLSSWDVSSVANIDSMFYRCTNLKLLFLSNWDISKLENIDSTFTDCMSLDYLDLSNWDTSSVKSMDSTFCNCEALVTLDLSSWNTSLVEYMRDMFRDCTSLTTVYAGDGWSTAAVTSSKDMFNGCTAIKGQSGTTYDSSKVDAAMANWETGYLTYKKDLDSETIAKLEKAAETRDLSTLTLDELGAVAADLEASGTSSKAYSAAKACAQAGAYRTTTYGATTVYMTLVSVLHDEDADGNALGFTWMLSAAAPSASYLMGSGDGVTAMAMSKRNTGGWGASAGRTTLNSTVLSNLTESGLSSLIKARKVPYGPTYNSTSESVSYRTDKLWLMSYHEVYGFITSSYSSSYDMTKYRYLANEGEQMDWFAANNVSTSNYSKLVGGSAYRWLRSCSPSHGTSFGVVYYYDGGPSYGSGGSSRAVFPCFSM